MATEKRTEKTQEPISLDQFPVELHRELLAETLMESPHGYVIVSSEEGGNSIIFVNRAFEEITGYRASEVLGLSCRFLLGADDDQESLTELRNAKDSKKKCTQVVRNYKKDGALFYNELSVYPILGHSGNVTHFVWTQHDVTPIIETKQNLLKTISWKDERFSAYMQHSNEALWRLDFQPPISMIIPEAEQVQTVIDRGVFGEMNDVGAKIYGYNKGKEVRGRPLSKYILETDQDNIQMIMKLVQCKYLMKNVLINEKTTNGDQIVTLNNIVPTINQGAVTHLWGASLDITEFLKNKKELQQSRDELDSQRRSLEKKNIALKELVTHIEFEKKDITDRLESYIAEVALPSLEKISLNKGKKIYIDLHRKVLENLTSSHAHKANNIRRLLTQREMEICDLVKNGNSNKEIAELLNIAIQTVMKHRRMVRKKLDLNNTKVNLYTYLNSL